MAENIPQLGKLITDGEKRRDAVHIAIAPVRAAETLKPGQHVGLVDEFLTEEVGTLSYGPYIGIVDPFLTEPVKRGEHFYLFLYPNTITSLRHVWSHPVFEEAARKVAKKTLEAFKKTVRES